MRRPVLLLLLLLLLFASLLTAAPPASADPGGDGPFRRTTPRAEVIQSGDWTLLAIPGGRAWGLESGLRPLGEAHEVRVELAAIDPEVREAFLRVAYYARSDGRSRQLEIADSEPVTVAAGPDGRTIGVRLEPPAGAVAYRVRLLARLFGRDGRSAAGAIRARWGDDGPRGGRPSLTRLLEDPP